MSRRRARHRLRPRSITDLDLTVCPDPRTRLGALRRDGDSVPEVRHAEDLEQVTRVLAGDESAWSAFVERYSGLLYAVIRRYLPAGEPDDARSVFADVLVSLRRAKLRTYEGRASLGTWLTLVARSETLDFLRRRFGRRRWRKPLESLDPTERSVFRLYYIEGRSPRELLDSLAAEGVTWTLERLVTALRAIERKLGDVWLRRLAYDLHAQSVGAASGRMLEYLDHVRDEFQHHAGAYSAEYHVLEREARRTSERLTSMIAALPAAERRMLELRFEQGWTARAIAQELGIDSARGVYTVTDRIVRRFRRLFRDADGDA